VGRRTVLYPGVYVGAGTTIGDDCILYPNVTVYDHCVLGDRVTLHSSTVVGQDGFGYATHGGKHEKIPQSGIVVVEDDVELGAGCAIERAAIEETRIGRGTKFADLISIGHGTRVGEHCLFVSLVGVSGSVEVGNYVAIGGQAGVTGHLKIGDGVQVMAKAAVVRDIEPGRRVGGVPAIDSEDAKRNALAAVDLYGLFKRVRQLERELKKLRAESGVD
jgi:UDP-3-O-[3-hydroxymyristoyl] glucosamine N-acyltransferase